MNTIFPLVVGIGLLGVGVWIMFFPGAADDPYRNRKFAFGKGSASQLVIGAIALLMGVTQLAFWLRAHF